MDQQKLFDKISEAAKTNATSLTLSYTSLADMVSLLPKISQLTNLTSLSIWETQLSSLPPEIGQLTNLTSLSLLGTQLSSLPPEIGQLTNLTSLDLWGNQLSNLPPEIGQLTSLTSLDLWGNQLSNLPPEIGQLINLTSLDLRSNQLSSLPLEIGQLTNLTSLALYEKQLSSLPPEIRKYCGDAKKAAVELPRYYRQFLEQDTERIYEAKLLILGEGGAGKTSLAKKIEDEDYQLLTSEESTEGIDIIRWQFPLEDEQDFFVNIWDFGGQEIYHATHQFFLTKRSLYILVADSRKEDTDFFYWLNIVNLLSESSPILIVNNEKQNRQRDLNERQLRGEFLNLEKVLATDLATNRGLTEIKQAVQQYILSLPHVGTELPKTWIKVRQSLENNPCDYISLTEYLTLCEENGFARLEGQASA